jgi:hypothetical protein
MMQVREFQKVRTLLFDGESALRSPAVQKEILNKLKIKIHAEPYWKRSMAERAIGEIKLRTAIHLDFHGTTPPPPLTTMPRKIKNSIFIGLALNKWKDNLQFVLDSINRNKPDYKSQLNELIQFFTSPVTTILPQENPKLYKFKIGDRVRISLTKAERTNLSFKYSLHYGK